jgi:hypothetical protein
LKTLIIILLLYFGFKYLARLFGPFLVKKAAETKQKKAEQQFGGQQPKETVKEGETIIDKAPKNIKQSKNSVGDYVDFEEID